MIDARIMGVVLALGGAIGLSLGWVLFAPKDRDALALEMLQEVCLSSVLAGAPRNVSSLEPYRVWPDEQMYWHAGARMLVRMAPRSCSVSDELAVLSETEQARLEDGFGVLLAAQTGDVEELYNELGAAGFQGAHVRAGGGQTTWMMVRWGDDYQPGTQVSVSYHEQGEQDA
ncbi:MAG: hypothetical protein AB8B51_16865 [Sedimentitalea sp.]